MDLRDRTIQLRYDRQHTDHSAVIIYYQGQRVGPARLLDAVANGLRHKGGIMIRSFYVSFTSL